MLTCLLFITINNLFTVKTGTKSSWYHLFVINSWFRCMIFEFLLFLYNVCSELSFKSFLQYKTEQIQRFEQTCTKRTAFSHFLYLYLNLYRNIYILCMCIYICVSPRGNELQYLIEKQTYKELDVVLLSPMSNKFNASITWYAIIEQMT